jgi:hypothetical protein
VENERVILYFQKQVPMFVERVKDLPKPLYIEFTFVRDSHRKFDYINAMQIVADQMKAYGWIPDDNCTELKPYFGDFQYDKEEPGCYITILKQQPNHYDIQDAQGGHRGLLCLGCSQPIIHQNHPEKGDAVLLGQ